MFYFYNPSSGATTALRLHVSHSLLLPHHRDAVPRSLATAKAKERKDQTNQKRINPSTSPFLTFLPLPRSPLFVIIIILFFYLLLFGEYDVGG